MTPDQLTEGDAGQCTDLPGQMRLVAVPAVGRDTGEVVAGPGTRDRPTETQHPRQRLRSVSVGPGRATTQCSVAPAEGRGDFRDGRAGGQRPREGGHRIVCVDRTSDGVDQCSDGIVLGTIREEPHTT